MMAQFVTIVSQSGRKWRGFGIPRILRNLDRFLAMLYLQSFATWGERKLAGSVRRLPMVNKAKFSVVKEGGSSLGK